MKRKKKKKKRKKKRKKKKKKEENEKEEEFHGEGKCKGSGRREDNMSRPETKKEGKKTLESSNKHSPHASTRTRKDNMKNKEE